MAMKIKLYVEPEKEIRVFAIDANSTFAALEERVMSITGKDKNVRLFWIDSEGDHIVFSTDDEFNEAKNTNQSPLRLVVKSRDQAANVEKMAHPGVTCDGCQGPVVGSRYKCLECPDFDLCEKCEPQGKHSNHEMVVIRNPDNNDWRRFFGPRFGGPSRRGPCGSRFGPAGPAGGPCGRGPRHGQHPRPFPPFMAPFLGDNVVDMDIDMNKPFPEIISDIAAKVQERVQMFQQQPAGQPQQPTETQEPMQTEEKMEATKTPTVVKNVETHVAETVMQRPQVSSAEVENGWTKLQAEPVEEETKPVEAVESKMENLQIGETKVDAALRTMQEMGFPNESGLLRRLLQNYNGDIGRVLDSLK